jgi:peptidoglycan/xylan/chitin deacetylase (PgdA/CDA1 family)
MRPWRPSPFIIVCIIVHGAALLLICWQPALWRWALSSVLLNHVVIAAAGLLPRCTWLGANLVRLPVASARRGEIAITIDDGPDPDVTPQVLAVLAQYGVVANFFCIGERAIAYPQLCQAMVVAGHAVENHGQLHRKHFALLGPRGWMREIAAGQATLTAITGQRPQFFRALAGLRNPFLDPVLQRLGVRLASWTRRGYDTTTCDADRVLDRLTRNLAAGDIFLLHDGNAARNAVGQPVILDVLPRLLRELARRQLKPVTLRSVCGPI